MSASQPAPKQHVLENFQLRTNEGSPEPIENLVLEGGGVKGSAYVGVVEVLEKEGVLPNLKRVAGSSAGGIMCLMIGLGMSAEDIKAEMAAVNFTQFQDYPQQTWAEFLSLPDAAGKKQAIDIEHMVVAARSPLKGAYPGDYFMSWAEKLIEKKLGKPNATFADLHHQMALGDTSLKDMVFTGTVLAGKNEKSLQYFRFDENNPEFNNMPIAKAVRITMSFPGAFEMVEHEGSYYADGGIGNNFPIDIFDDQRYLASNGHRTAQGKNPRTIGFKIDSYEEWALQKDLIQIAINAGLIHNRNTPITPEIYGETILWGVENKQLTTKEAEILLNQDLARNVQSRLSMTNYLGNLMGAMMDDRNKVSLYPGRAFQIYDQNISCLDFSLGPQKIDQLINAGSQVAREFIDQYEHEKSQAFSDPTHYQQKLQELSRLIDEAITTQDIGSIAIAYDLVQNSLKTIEQELGTLNNAVHSHPHNPLWSEQLKTHEQLVQASKAWLLSTQSKINSPDTPAAMALQKRYPMLLASQTAQSALLAFQAQQAQKASHLLAPKIANVDLEDSISIMAKSLQETLLTAQQELLLAEKIQQELNSELAHFKTVQEKAKALLNQKGFREHFWITIDTIQKTEKILKSQEEQLIHLSPGDNPRNHRIIVEKISECRETINAARTRFQENLEVVAATEPPEVRELIAHCVDQGIVNDWHWQNPEHINQYMAQIENQLHQKSQACINAQENLRTQIQDTQQELGNLTFRQDRSQFFSQLVNLKQTLDNDLKEHQLTLKDYLLYGCENCWGIGYLFRNTFGDHATQKHLRAQEALALKAVVDETYDAYRSNAWKNGQLPDTSILTLLVRNIRFAEQKLKNRFLEEFEATQGPLADPSPQKLSLLQKKTLTFLKTTQEAPNPKPQKVSRHKTKPRPNPTND